MIGTRGSKLALWQANKVKTELEALNFICELKIIKTQGDKIQNLGFDKLEGKGFFTKEIEDALIAKRIDVAVHSLKDLPTDQPEGLAIGGLSERATPNDLLIINQESYSADHTLGLAPGAVVGTSSVRRKAQILHLAPEVSVQDLRGNVPTRINKLSTENYDAIILAAAGVERLDIDLTQYKTVLLNTQEYVPAPGQGVVAYQVRAEDKEMRRIIGLIHHPESAKQTNIERTVLKMMSGGCQMPLGVHCELDKAGNYHVSGAYSQYANKELIKVRLSQSTSHNLAVLMTERLQKPGK